MHGIKHVALTSETFVIAYCPILDINSRQYVVYTVQYASLAMLQTEDSVVGLSDEKNRHKFSNAAKTPNFGVYRPGICLGFHVTKAVYFLEG